MTYDLYSEKPSYDVAQAQANVQQRKSLSTGAVIAVLGVSSALTVFVIFTFILMFTGILAPAGSISDDGKFFIGIGVLIAGSLAYKLCTSIVKRG